MLAQVEVQEPAMVAVVQLVAVPVFAVQNMASTCLREELLFSTNSFFIQVVALPLLIVLSLDFCLENNQLHSMANFKVKRDTTTKLKLVMNTAHAV